MRYVTVTVNGHDMAMYYEGSHSTCSKSLFNEPQPHTFRTAYDVTDPLLVPLYHLPK